MRTIGKVGSFMLLVGTLWCLSGATCLPDNPLSGDGNSSGDITSQYAQQVFEMVNQQRAANNVAPVVWNDLLAKAASDYAERMADLNFVNHIDPYNGNAPWDRAAAAGYEYTLIGENLASGQRTPDEVMTGWMNSPGHRATLLDPDLTELGVGVYKGGSYGWYWVELFGHPQ